MGKQSTVRVRMTVEGKAGIYLMGTQVIGRGANALIFPLFDSASRLCRVVKVTHPQVAASAPDALASEVAITQRVWSDTCLGKIVADHTNQPLYHTLDQRFAEFGGFNQTPLQQATLDVLVMPYSDAPLLEDYLQHPELSDWKKFSLLWQLFRTLLNLYDQQGAIHSDCKLQNAFVCPQTGEIKWFDFGGSRNVVAATPDEKTKLSECILQSLGVIGGIFLFLSSDFLAFDLHEEVLDQLGSKKFFVDCAKEERDLRTASIESGDMAAEQLYVATNTNMLGLDISPEIYRDKLIQLDKAFRELAKQHWPATSDPAIYFAVNRDQALPVSEDGCTSLSVETAVELLYQCLLLDDVELFEQRLGELKYKYEITYEEFLGTRLACSNGDTLLHVLARKNKGELLQRLLVGNQPDSVSGMKNNFYSKHRTMTDTLLSLNKSGKTVLDILFQQQQVDTMRSLVAFLNARITPNQMSVLQTHFDTLLVSAEHFVPANYKSLENKQALPAHCATLVSGAPQMVAAIKTFKAYNTGYDPVAIHRASASLARPKPMRNPAARKAPSARKIITKKNVRREVDKARVCAQALEKYRAHNGSIRLCFLLAITKMRSYDAFAKCLIQRANKNAFGASHLTAIALPDLATIANIKLTAAAAAA